MRMKLDREIAEWAEAKWPNTPIAGAILAIAWPLSLLDDVFQLLHGCNRERKRRLERGA